jgi:hypothetical protein
VSGAGQGNSEASAADKLTGSGARGQLISVINGIYSIISDHIDGPIFHLFLLYSIKHGKKVTLISTY